MLAPTLLSVALVVLWSAVGLCSSSPCKKLEVRREWRALNATQKAEWIRAVKVRVDTSLTLAVMTEAVFHCSACHNCPMTQL